MGKLVKLLFVFVFVNITVISLYGQFYHYKYDSDTCNCKDFVAIGIKHFDTLTEVVPPKSYTIHCKKRDINSRITKRRYDYATEKKYIQEILLLNKDKYLYSIFNKEVYIVADWPYTFYYKIIHCVNDSIRKIIDKNMYKYFLTYQYLDKPYVVKNFRCIDHRQQLFFVVLMNVEFYNKVVNEFNFCPSSYILPEFDENISKGLYVKVLLPYYDD